MTGTNDTVGGWVVDVVGMCGSRRWNGTRLQRWRSDAPGSGWRTHCKATAAIAPAATRPPTAGAGPPGLAPHSGSPSSVATGNVTTKRAPPAGDDSTRTSPCMRRTCSATRASPNPVPVPVPRRPETGPRKKRSNIWVRSPRIDAGPSSSTLMSTWPSPSSEASPVAASSGPVALAQPKSRWPRRHNWRRSPRDWP